MEPDVQDVSFAFKVEQPELWSAEQPTLYEAEIALLNGKTLVERTGLKVGLRRFELKDRQILLNGKRIVFKGSTATSGAARPAALSAGKKCSGM